jgi:hypothetical protein
MTEESPAASDEDIRRARIEAGVLSVREGHGANCSSVGSVIDTIFASAVVGGAVFAAVVASLVREKPQVVGGAGEPVPSESPPPPSAPERPEE